ncbi:MAG: D-alanyl-D-alanine carboxypeptidase [Peptococcaceae bacterium]|nr:D-alanyl-D-alanine carboxypeptidase [Peptococcaceae bacterium]MDR2736038.1 D-alanyl-D-alanine carboxypeptidase [Gracilibacteraceae bacterium]
MKSSLKYIYYFCLLTCLCILGAGFTLAAELDISEDFSENFSEDFSIMFEEEPVWTPDKLNLGVSLETTAASAVLMDAATGRILFEKEPNLELPPASVTKLMTLLIAAEAVEKGRVTLQEKVTTSPEASAMGGSQVYLEVGEQMTLKDMLMAVAVGSGNDASVAVAEHIGGSEADFVDEMNQKAADLGLKNSHFVNPHGLPAEGHYTSAYDMAVIGRECLKYPLLLELTATKEYKLRSGAFQLYNTNRLLWWYQGTEGFKTGSTAEAKHCLASTVQRDGLRLITVVMGCPQSQGHFQESMKIYNYGFAKYIYKTYVSSGTPVAYVPISKGAQTSVAVVPQQEIGICFEKGQDAAYRYECFWSPAAAAPVEPGQELGYAVIFFNDEEVSRVKLIAAQAVPRLSLPGMVVRTFSDVFGL